MAVLSDPDRAAINAEFQADVSDAREGLGALTKADVRAAVDAADTWANSNATAYNSALPTAARTALSAGQKARLLMYVMRKRFLTGA